MTLTQDQKQLLQEAESLAHTEGGTASDVIETGYFDDYSRYTEQDIAAVYDHINA